MDELKPDEAIAVVIIEDGETDTLVADLAESLQSASSASLKTELAQAAPSCRSPSYAPISNS